MNIFQLFWDDCSLYEEEKLEKVKLFASSLGFVTDLPILALKESFYLETGWEPLKKRRYEAKMTTMFKINTGLLTE